MANRAFIDAQNLYLGTTLAAKPWQVDLERFRVYLREKYKVDIAYYFMGCRDPRLERLYDSIQKAGYILRFRSHSVNLSSNKKGNVDTDVIFTVMEMIYYREKFDQVILVSGDGDYYKMVNFLAKENKLAKILFPNRKFSSTLYTSLDNRLIDSLDTPDKIKKFGLAKYKKRALLK